jgi:hypothetical protein
MTDGAQVEARLLPGGQVALLGADADLAASWQVLGCTLHQGCFVRAEVAGVSWVTHIPKARLPRQDREVLVTLARQSDAPQEPLMGWILFC